MTFVPSLNAGRHACGVVTSAGTHVRMASNWIGQSLDAGMQVVWAASSADAVVDGLDTAGVAWKAALNRGQLRIDHPGNVVGVGSADDIPARLRDAVALTEQASAAGFAGLSVGVDCIDALAVIPDVKTQLAVEVAWERFTRTHPVSVLCLYRREATREHVAQAIATHPRELIDPLVSVRVVATCIVVRGEVDISNAELLRTFLAAAVREPDVGDDDVVLDLRGLRFIDVIGGRELVGLARELAPRRLRLADAPVILRRVLELAGWRQDLELVDSAGWRRAPGARDEA